LKPSEKLDMMGRKEDEEYLFQDMKEDQMNYLLKLKARKTVERTERKLGGEIEGFD